MHNSCDVFARQLRCICVTDVMYLHGNCDASIMCLAFIVSRQDTVSLSEKVTKKTSMKQLEYYLCREDNYQTETIQTTGF